MSPQRGSTGLHLASDSNFGNLPQKTTPKNLGTILRTLGAWAVLRNLNSSAPVMREFVGRSPWFSGDLAVLLGCQGRDARLGLEGQFSAAPGSRSG